MFLSQPDFGNSGGTRAFQVKSCFILTLLQFRRFESIEVEFFWSPASRKLLRAKTLQNDW